MSGMYIVYMNMCVILNAVLAGGKRRRRQEGKRVEERTGKGRIKGEREERYLCVCTEHYIVQMGSLGTCTSYKRNIQQLEDEPHAVQGLGRSFMYPYLRTVPTCCLISLGMVL